MLGFYGTATSPVKRSNPRRSLDPESHAIHNAIPDLYPCDEFKRDAPIHEFAEHIKAGCQQCGNFYERMEMKLAMIKRLRQSRN